ncbi:D-alanine--D-alanine ligase [Odoribacter sp. OttesenSCG-928-J03]|nr:D-alanine--D-alanine ligase [Odoribacter sp. OttesenSCG-928-J03]MDL2331005.1 D-alanine--D-alanine ligase [Odoribacter sp. OttesenSCG-928-A06]
MSKKNIVVIAGGNSAEYEISIKSGNFVYSVIDAERYNKYLMVLHKQEWNVVVGDHKYPVDRNDFSVLIEDEEIRFDFAYITIHGNPGENGMLQGYLDMMEIPYSTSSLLCEAMTFDKFVCTNYLQAFGINTTEPVMLTKGCAYDKKTILDIVGLPCFVKPNSEGSSFGVSKVKLAEEFDNAIEQAFEKCSEILIEPFIDGIEFTCGLYRVGEKKIIFPVAEVVPKKEFFDFEAKYDATMSDEIIPGRFSEEITEEIQSMASEVYDILRCEGIIRIDGFVRGEEVIMLEVNTTPGMTANSFIPKMAKVMGVELGDVLSEIIEDKLA